MKVFPPRSSGHKGKTRPSAKRLWERRRPSELQPNRESSTAVGRTFLCWVSWLLFVCLFVCLKIGKFSCTLFFTDVFQYHTGTYAESNPGILQIKLLPRLLHHITYGFCSSTRVGFPFSDNSAALKKQIKKNKKWRKMLFLKLKLPLQAHMPRDTQQSARESGASLYLQRSRSSPC